MLRPANIYRSGRSGHRPNEIQASLEKTGSRLS